MRLESQTETRLSPEQVVAALTDFSERRPQMWTAITPSFYEVYAVGDREARVREGTKQGPLTVWAKEHYTWSSPNVVQWTVEESNFCTPGSFVRATITPRDGGGAHIRCEWERTPTTIQARIMFGMLKLTGGAPIKAAMNEGLANYEREFLD